MWATPAGHQEWCLGWLPHCVKEVELGDGEGCGGAEQTLQGGHASQRARLDKRQGKEGLGWTPSTPPAHPGSLTKPPSCCPQRPNLGLKLKASQKWTRDLEPGAGGRAHRLLRGLQLRDQQWWPHSPPGPGWPVLGRRRCHRSHGEGASQFPTKETELEEHLFADKGACRALPTLP